MCCGGGGGGGGGCKNESKASGVCSIAFRNRCTVKEVSLCAERSLQLLRKNASH